MHETLNLQVADRIRDVAEFFLIRGLFLLFVIAFYIAAFCHFIELMNHFIPWFRINC